MRHETTLDRNLAVGNDVNDPTSKSAQCSRRRIALAIAIICVWLSAGLNAALAQAPPLAPATAPASGATLAASPLASVQVEAVLTDDGQRIDQGLIWRVFSRRGDTDSRPKLIATHREAAPLLRLPPGDYTVNVAFGRSHLTRKLSLKPGENPPSRFVLNAGGLRIVADVGGAPPPPNTLTYTIQSDDQSGNRATVISGVKPGVVIRLNAGIYQIVSTYGDANATVKADVTVEAGKLTEAAVTHSAARVAFKLVAQPGGDAVADTQWSVQTLSGEIVKESVGAVPTHILAPGTYAAIARKGGKAFRRDFLIRDGETVQVEVVMQ